MANEIAVFKNFGIATPASVNYSAPMNAFVGNAWVSCTGRTYCNAMRFGEGILIKEDVGSNAWGTYLNAVRIYDLASRKQICEHVFPMYCGLRYSKETVKRVVRDTLVDTILKAAKECHRYVDEGQIRKGIADMLSRSFETHQVEMLNRQAKALGY